MRCIIKNALLLMWHDCRFILEKHDVIIDDHLIIGLDVQANVDTVYDYKDRILLPAFFNIHCHLGEYYFKNLCKEKSTITNYLRSTEEYNNSLSLQEFNMLGLSGQDNSSLKRLIISKKLHIGKCNSKTMYKRLNMLGITYQELLNILKEKNNG